jgi:nitrogen fixation NifU-like protein
MSGNIKNLYPDRIKAHNEHPYHFIKKDTLKSIKAYNPVCGDKFEIYIAEDNNTITALYFEGFGCAISKASTSVMARTLEGKSYKDALQVCNTFLQFIDDKSAGMVLDEDLTAFSAVHQFPERRDCAGLPWNEFRKFLESKNKNQR